MGSNDVRALEGKQLKIGCTRNSLDFDGRDARTRVEKKFDFFGALDSKGCKCTTASEVMKVVKGSYGRH